MNHPNLKKKKKNYLNFFEKLAKEVILDLDRKKEDDKKEEEDIEDSPYHKLELASKFKRKARIINSILRPSIFSFILYYFNISLKI